MFLAAFLIASIACTKETKAQTLLFSKALLVTSADTVPAGKIWKVESAPASTTLGINSSSTAAQGNANVILVNGIALYIKSTWGSSYSSSAISATDLPIWLPEGTTLAAGTNTAMVSVLEFTVSP
jgi:hypothetical protein